MGNPVAVFGTGGHAREVVGTLHDLGRAGDIVAFHEPDDVHRPRELLGVPVKPQSEFNPGLCEAIVGIGNPAFREKVVGELPTQTRFPAIVHPSAVVSQWVALGEGALVCAGSILTVDISFGRHCHVNLGSILTHDCTLGDFVTLGPGTNLSGNCTLGSRVDVGTQTSLKQGVSVCDDVVIGMGAVVISDIVEPGTYVGVPAKKVGG